MRNALTIAGSDSCAGAGIQADLKTFAALGTYGLTVITAITAQNTQGVLKVKELDADIISAQIDCLFADIPIHAIKIGMVSSPEIIRAIAGCLSAHSLPPLVLDPVLVSKSGCRLLRPEAQLELIQLLFPLADMVTPNIPEAQAITGDSITDLSDMRKAAIKLHRLGAKSVVVKGGHLSSADSTDVFYDGEQFTLFSGNRIHTLHTHGTGCTFSSAIAAYLARGCPPAAAVQSAKEYITGAIQHSFPLGRGVGPTNHFYSLYQRREAATAALESQT